MKIKLSIYFAITHIKNLLENKKFSREGFMKKNLYICLNLFTGLFLSSLSLQAIEQEKQITMQMYNLLKNYPNHQDVIINNKIVKKSIYNCDQRYQAIKTILDQYKREITVLDLGAKLGYYSFRIANDYQNSTCVMLESSYSEPQLADQLLTLCKLNTNLNNIVLLKNKISQKDLAHLTDCEHFDVVLALDFVIDKDLNWKKTIDTILTLGNTILIQTSNNPENKNANNIDTYLSQKNGIVIFQAENESNPKIQNKIYWFNCNKTSIRCKRFIAEPKNKYLKLFYIESDYDHKYLLKKGCNHPINWKRGINLFTFLMLNGVYPTKSQIKKEVIKFSNERLSDFHPGNIIVQGKNVKLIDQEGAKRDNVPMCLDYILTVIDKNTQESIKNYIDSQKPYSKKRHNKK